MKILLHCHYWKTTESHIREKEIINQKIKQCYNVFSVSCKVLLFAHTRFCTNSEDLCLNASAHFCPTNHNCTYNIYWWSLWATVVLHISWPHGLWTSIYWSTKQHQLARPRSMTH